MADPTLKATEICQAIIEGIVWRPTTGGVSLPFDDRTQSVHVPRGTFSATVTPEMIAAMDSKILEVLRRGERGETAPPSTPPAWALAEAQAMASACHNGRADALSVCVKCVATRLVAADQTIATLTAAVISETRKILADTADFRMPDGSDCWCERGRDSGEHQAWCVKAREFLVRPASLRERVAAERAVIAAARRVMDADWSFRAVPEEVSELRPAFEAVDALAALAARPEAT